MIGRGRTAAAVAAAVTLGMAGEARGETQPEPCKATSANASESYTPAGRVSFDGHAAGFADGVDLAAVVERVAPPWASPSPPSEAASDRSVAFDKRVVAALVSIERPGLVAAFLDADAPLLVEPVDGGESLAEPGAFTTTMLFTGRLRMTRVERGYDGGVVSRPDDQFTCTDPDDSNQVWTIGVPRITLEGHSLRVPAAFTPPGLGSSIVIGPGSTSDDPEHLYD